MTALTFNSFAAKSIARYGSTRAFAAANQLHYFRLKYLLERRTWPQYTRLEYTEYGFILECRNRNRRPLARLVEAESRV